MLKYLISPDAIQFVAYSTGYSYASLTFLAVSFFYFLPLAREQPHLLLESLDSTPFIMMMFRTIWSVIALWTNVGSSMAHLLALFHSWCVFPNIREIVVKLYNNE